MAIKVSCQECSRVLSVPDQAAGRVMQCPDCGQRTRVPGNRLNAVVRNKSKPAPEDVSSPSVDDSSAGTDDWNFDDLARMEREAKHDVTAARKRVRPSEKRAREISEEEVAEKKPPSTNRLANFPVQKILAVGTLGVTALVISLVGARLSQWNSTRTARAAVLKQLMEPLHEWSQGGFNRMAANPVRRGPVLVFARSQSSGHLDINNPQGLGPIDLSSITADLPPEMQATGSEPVITVCMLTLSKYFVGKKYRRVKAEPGAQAEQWGVSGTEGTETITGGVEIHGRLVMGYWRQGKLEFAGEKMFRSETPDVLVSKLQLSMAPPVGPLIRDWLVSLPAAAN